MKRMIFAVSIFLLLSPAFDAFAEDECRDVLLMSLADTYQVSSQTKIRDFSSQQFCSSNTQSLCKELGSNLLGLFSAGAFRLSLNGSQCENLYQHFCSNMTSIVDVNAAFQASASVTDPGKISAVVAAWSDCMARMHGPRVSATVSGGPVKYALTFEVSKPNIRGLKTPPLKVEDVPISNGVNCPSLRGGVSLEGPAVSVACTRLSGHPCEAAAFLTINTSWGVPVSAWFKPVCSCSRRVSLSKFAAQSGLPLNQPGDYDLRAGGKVTVEPARWLEEQGFDRISPETTIVTTISGLISRQANASGQTTSVNIELPPGAQPKADLLSSDPRGTAPFNGSVSTKGKESFVVWAGCAGGCGGFNVRESVPDQFLLIDACSAPASSATSR